MSCHLKTILWFQHIHIIWPENSITVSKHTFFQRKRESTSLTKDIFSILSQEKSILSLLRETMSPQDLVPFWSRSCRAHLARILPGADLILHARSEECLKVAPGLKQFDESYEKTQRHLHTAFLHIMSRYPLKWVTLVWTLGNKSLVKYEQGQKWPGTALRGWTPF